jgi:putative transposase
VKYAWIKQHEAEFSVKSMCRFMSVSRSAYYAWLVRPLTAIEKDDAELIVIIPKGSKELWHTASQESLIQPGSAGQSPAHWPVNGRFS